MTTTPITTIRIPASEYEDHDDCLSAAKADYCAAHDMAGCDLNPRWDDDDYREAILLDIPGEITARVTGRGPTSTVPDNAGAVDADIYRGDRLIGAVTLLRDPGQPDWPLTTWGTGWDHWADSQMQAALGEADDHRSLIATIEGAVNAAATCTNLHPRPQADPLRCNYSDCIEGHPVIPEDDESRRVTCPTCREDMGIERAPEDQDR